MIACISIPDFAIAVERRGHSDLRPVPLLLAQALAGKVYTASSEAAACGVQPGMPLRPAQVLCPTAQTRPADVPRYQHVFAGVLDVLRECTHLTEPGGDAWQPQRAKRQPAVEPDAVYYLNLERLQTAQAVDLCQRLGRTVEERCGLLLLGDSGRAQIALTRTQQRVSDCRAAVSRLWPTGEAIGVLADDTGLPQRVIWQGQPRAVEGVARRWRVDTDWGRGRVYREYFKLTTRSGLLLLIYHDLVADIWFLSRLYD